MSYIETPMDRAYFNRGIAHFLLYRTKNMNLNIPDGYVYSDGFELARFATDLRQMYKNKELTEEQIDRLTDIGFAFDENDQNWESLYKLVADYIKDNGKPPARNYKTSDGIMIGAWHYRQKQIFYQLSGVKKEKLLALGREEYDAGN